jgi:hypothetical protein
MSNTGKTDIRHCEACGQVRFPIDHWQRKMLVLKDQLTCALLEAKENFEIANEFKHTMEEYRQRETAAYLALRERQVRWMPIPLPLTKEAVGLLIGNSLGAQSWLMSVVRAIERAHGIGEKE